MDAIILAVGSELLGTDRLDTNSLRLTACLDRFGHRLQRKVVVGDDEREIAEQIDRAVASADLLLITGGLGPTQDDLTRAAVARATGRELRSDPDVIAHIEGLYRRFGRPMPVTNCRQAEVLEGARVLDNPVGTAPGQLVEHRGCFILLFPGVPRELEAMIDSELVPFLREHASSNRRGMIELRTACVAESAVEATLDRAYEEYGRESIAVLARPGEVRVRILAEAPADELEDLLEERRALVAPLLGDALFSAHGEELEEVVVRGLAARGQTLAVAESCTGGMVGARLTRVSGSSAVFEGGAIVYSNRMKTELVGVDAELIQEHGAVSAEVACALAEGAARRFHADWGLGITGVAGPGGGSDAKPVGSVHLAVAGEARTDVLSVRFPGDRQRVREQATQLGIDMVRRRLQGLPVQTFWVATETTEGGSAEPSEVPS